MTSTVRYTHSQTLNSQLLNSPALHGSPSKTGDELGNLTDWSTVVVKTRSYVDKRVLDLAYVFIRRDRRDLMVSFDISERVAKLFVVRLRQRLVGV